MRRTQSALRARSNSKFFSLLENLESRVLLTAVTQYHMDNQSTGINSSETLLTPSTVNVVQFGKQFSTPVDGQVFAEPLYVPSLNITVGAQQGVHNVVFVATEHATLYAIDSTGGNILWSTSFLNVNNAAVNILGATAIIPFDSNHSGSADLTPEIGMTATPVIDQAAGYLYCVAKTEQAIAGFTAGSTTYVQVLYKVDIHSGNVVGSALIGETNNTGTGNTNGTVTYVSNGLGAATPYSLGTGNGVTNNTTYKDSAGGTGKVYFNAQREFGRVGLSLVNGQIILGFASHGDNSPYHGWMLAYDKTTLAIKGALNTTPNGGLGGIWQGGGSIVVDSQGYFYFETGNGSFNTSTSNFAAGSTGLPKDANYGDSFVKVAVDNVVTTQAAVNTALNPNGWGFKIVDFFSPSNNTTLNNGDVDLGSGGPTILPDAVGSAAHPHLLIGAGKEGKLYLIDRDNMGGFISSTDRVVQELQALTGQLNQAAFLLNNTSGTQSGTLYVLEGYNTSHVKTFTISNGVLSAITNTSASTYGSLSGSPTVSANGINNAIVWGISRGNNSLIAVRGDTLATLWDSTQAAANRDQLGNVTKFSVPTVADGQVFVGTANALVVYGPPTPPTSAPAAPTGLSASSPVFNTVNLTWADNSSNEDSFLIERATSAGGPYTQVGFTSSNATTYTDTTALATTTYYYRVRAHNTYQTDSYSAYTNVAPVTTPQAPPTGTGDGAGAQYFNNKTWTAPVVLSRVDPTINFNWGTVSPGGSVTADNYSVMWTGRIQAQYTQTYTFYTQSDDGIQLKIKPAGSATWTTVISNLSDHGSVENTGTYAMSAGSLYDFEVDYYENAGSAIAQLSWSGTQTPKAIVPQTQLYSGTAPGTPTNLTITPQASFELDLAWTDNGTNETGYEVQRMDPQNAWATIATIAANSTTFIDSGLTPGVAYSYRVRATNFITNSAYSNTATYTTPVSPNKPSDAHQVTVTKTSISFAWTDNSDNETGFRILRAGYVPGQQEENFNTIALPAADNVNPAPHVMTYTDSGQSIPLQPGTQYDYHIQAYNLGGFNDFTGFTTETITNAPTNPVATEGGNAIGLTWTPPTFNSDDPFDLTFNIYRTTNSNGTGATLIASGVETANYTDATAVSGTTYYYSVTAVDLGGESVASTLASATVRPPTVQNAASASPNPVTGTSTGLSVLGADNNGEAGLTYTWSVLTKPAGAPDPTFTVNGTNAAKASTANFSYSGNYTFRVVIKDAANNTVSSDTSSVSVTFGFTGVTGGASHFTYGSNIYTLFADSGTVALASDLSAGGKSVNLNVVAGATVTINSTQNLKAITIDAGSTINMPAATPHRVLAGTSVSINATGKIDLFNNDMIIDYGTNSSPEGTIETYIKTGRNNGTWNGSGIRSTTAGANPGSYALNAMDNNESATPYNSFDGINTSSHKQVLIRYTYIADLDLDGKDTTNDAISFATFYSEGAAGNHYHGDLNYDGTVNFNDAITFSTTYNESLIQITDVGGIETVPLALKQQATPTAAGPTPIPPGWTTGIGNVKFEQGPLFISATSAKSGVTLKWRAQAKGPVYTLKLPQVKGPVMLKIERVGNIFAAFYSQDGVNWSKIGTSKTLQLPAGGLTNVAVTA